MTTTKRIEVFRPGTFTPMQGAPVTMTADDLKAIAASYDPAGAPTPIVVGHPKTEDAAYGWAKAFSYDEASERLVADCDQIAPEFSDQVSAGRYKRISLSLFAPDAPNNPKPGAWYPKHIGFLGAAAPAVSGLKPVHFSGDDTGVMTFEFGDPAFKDVANLFRKIRDYFIEKHDVATADGIVPDWQINWIDDAGRRDDPSSFSEPKPQPEPSSMTKPSPEPSADFAEREQRLKEREDELNRRARAQANADNLAFAEALVAEGRLLPVSRDKVVAVLDAVSDPAHATEASFAEGGQTVTKDVGVLFREVLKAQPKVVSFGETDLGEGGERRSVDFAAPAGMQVDPEGLALLARAQAHQRKHPGTSLPDAITAVQG